MIESDICNDCICLAVCLNKTTVSLMYSCSYLTSVLNDISKTLDVNEEITISFAPLNRKFLIEKRKSKWRIVDTKLIELIS